MFNTILKKKLSDNQVANIFINALFDSVDSGWGEIATMINEDPAFVTTPGVNSADSGKFGLIIITANISLLESTFEVEQASRIEKLVFQKLAKIYGMGELEFENLIRSYQSFISRVNHPSKNMIYGMSKGVFHKYNLNKITENLRGSLNEVITVTDHGKHGCHHSNRQGNQRILSLTHCKRSRYTSP